MCFSHGSAVQYMYLHEFTIHKIYKCPVKTINEAQKSIDRTSIQFYLCLLAVANENYSIKFQDD